MKDLEVRMVKDHDWPKIQELFITGKDKGHGKDYWIWKYKEHPWNRGSPLAVVAVDEDRIVSFFGSLPMRISSGDRVLQANQILDLFTALDYRRKGIFRKEQAVLFQEMQNRGDSFSMGFAGERAGSINGLLTMGYTHICNLARVTKVYDSESFIKYGDPSKRTKIARRLFSFKANGKYSKLPGTLHEHSKFIGEMEAACSSNKMSAAFSVECTSEYMNWRSRNPEGEYLFLTKQGKKDVEGFLMFAVREDGGMRHGIIMDCVAKDDETALELIRGVDGLAMRHDIALVRAQAIKDSRFHSALKKAGFADQTAKTAFVIKEIGSVPEISREKKWHITVSDTDHA